MHAVLVNFLLLLGRLAPATGPVAASVELPHAILIFSFGNTPTKWTSTFEMTTAAGESYEVAVSYSGDTILSRETLSVLLGANWMVDQEFGTNEIRIYGTRTRDGSLDAIRSLRIINRPVEGRGELPQLASVGRVKIEVASDLESPPMTRKRRLNGPELHNESYVEFDIAPLPAPALGEDRWQLALGVSFRAGDPYPDYIVGTDIDPRKPWKVLENVLESLTDAGCKVQIVGKTRLRVYGRVTAGRFHRALKGCVESDDLRPEELPKVTSARS